MGLNLLVSLAHAGLTNDWWEGDRRYCCGNLGAEHIHFLLEPLTHHGISSVWTMHYPENLSEQFCTSVYKFPGENKSDMGDTCKS